MPINEIGAAALSTPNQVLEVTAAIVAAHLRGTDTKAAHVPEIIRQVYDALTELVEGSGATQLAAVLQRLHTTPVGYGGVAGVQRDDPAAWLVTPGTPRTLASLRATPELRKVDAVQQKRFRVVDPTLFTPRRGAIRRRAGRTPDVRPFCRDRPAPAPPRG